MAYPGVQGVVMRITFLGSGNAFVPQRDWGCVLVNDTILLDAGPSMLASLKRLGGNPAAIRHIFISHFHGDHFFGLPFLLLEYYFVTRTSEPLAIVGPPGVEEMVTKTMTLAYPDIMSRGWPRPLHFQEVAPGAVQTIDGVAYEAIEVEHGGDVLRAFGYRLHLPDGVLCYSGDTSMTDAIFDLVAGARAIIIEAASQDDSAVHLGREAMRTILARVPQDSVVFLNHLDTPSADPWRGWKVIVPEDLRSYEVRMTEDQRPEVHYV
jgi:ribonuclease BN (tRNA processing enzyme)